MLQTAGSHRNPLHFGASMSRRLLLALMLALPLFATACNTIEGFGEDMEKGGENIQNSADENK
jgi:predicted small secreted protein